MTISDLLRACARMVDVIPDADIDMIWAHKNGDIWIKLRNGTCFKYLVTEDMLTRE